MKDPTRISSEAGTFEARLLESVRDVNPPAAARDEVWRRVGIAVGAGAVTLGVAAPLAAHAAEATGAVAGAGAKLLTQSTWLSAIKWVALAATVGPAVGAGVHWALTSRKASAPSTMITVSSPERAAPLETLAPSKQAPAESVQADPDRAPAGPAAGVVRHGAAPSSLDAESALLKRAREKLESGDSKGALDDVALLSTRFPRGELTQEREVVAIKALLAQGQRSAATARTAELLRLHPSSPYAEALKQALR